MSWFLWGGRGGGDGKEAGAPRMLSSGVCKHYLVLGDLLNWLQPSSHSVPPHSDCTCYRSLVLRTQLRLILVLPPLSTPGRLGECPVIASSPWHPSPTTFGLYPHWSSASIANFPTWARRDREQRAQTVRQELC